VLGPRSRKTRRSAPRRRQRLFCVSALWLFTLCVGSLLPAGVKTALGTMGTAHDFIHLGAFGITSMLLMLWGRTRRQEIGLATVAMALGVVIEMAEGRLGGNPIELGDIQLDVLGALLALVLFQFRAARNPIETIARTR
jgi:hypothetical protein